MTVFQALTLMISFGVLVLMLSDRKKKWSASYAICGGDNWSRPFMLMCLILIAPFRSYRGYCHSVGVGSTDGFILRSLCFYYTRILGRNTTEPMEKCNIRKWTVQNGAASKSAEWGFKVEEDSEEEFKHNHSFFIIYSKLKRTKTLFNKALSYWNKL